MNKKILKIISICCVVAIVLGFIISQFIFQHTTVHGISMQSTLEDKDVLIINKLTYEISKPERYDIVLFKTSSDEYYIKRIIGMPNETIQIRSNGYVYIDGERILTDYGYELIDEPGIAKDGVTLGDDEYFMLGDNRNFSTDSRDPSVGIINCDDIIGKAVYCIGPFDRFGPIDYDANIEYYEYLKTQEKY